jgi:hypothetical protein
MCSPRELRTQRTWVKIEILGIYFVGKAWNKHFMKINFTFLE